MATSSQLSVPDQIRQLEGARKLVLGDVSYYPQVIQATLPIIGPSAQVEFRRWGAEFLAEAFSTPAVPLGQKETLSLLVLETLKHLVEDPEQDVMVLRSVIQTAASVYPLALRWIISNAYDTNTWSNITAIKSRILRIWENAPPTVRICCIKFAQRVVLAQTPSINPEPRRGDPLDISLNMIPPNHTVLNVHSLEAEATGLLDRMLGVLQDNSSDALTVDATMNTLSILIRMRPSTSNRVLNIILNFNPLKLANTPMTSKTRVLVRSLEKTTRMLLTHLARRDPRNPLAGKIQQYLERLMQSRAEMAEGASRKRAMMEQADGIEAKRQRMGPVQAEFQITPLKAGPLSLADIFTFTQNEGLRNFDVSLVAAPLAAKVSVNTIARVDPKILDRAIAGVRERLAELHKVAAQPINPETAALDIVEDDDDYEPDYYVAEDTEQILNKLDSEPSAQSREMQKPAVLGTLALPTFKLPPPPPLNPDQALQVGNGTVTRVFGVMSTIDDSSARKTKAGINRLAASSYNRDSWITIITRLATRAAAGLSDNDEESRATLNGVNLSNSIREQLYIYVLEDFRKRIDVAVSWLSEEWYNDRVQQRAASAEGRGVPAHYEKWALRLLDGFLPYLHAQDKVLTRFLSEIPDISTAILSRVKTLCRDPTMVERALQGLLYLVMMRPPAKEIALDTVQDIWIEYDEARTTAGKYLTKYRPGFLDQQRQLQAVNASGSVSPAGAGQAVVAS
ncbi:mRNA cleavage and polyadenylation specificity factor complex subunit [Xylariales sp. AK1849]|nr:mRNA cleavage and polyadenylation specificity factor complex subunit [Xylariales sp. AK1849]